ncbi:hypothetical protein LW135_01815 [Helicobacter sp. faydin-H20]|uniref:hypothetical protein n=1 Tax=Helicobacter anatolicus TaxID=2905874 RepID=UPI001E534EE5|nr:hypothetical protein [Helicobacter anatolicus]MCE3036571.1 hypothetical protein [Helicobacter anatolicus]
MNWHDQLKIAILEKNTQKAFDLITQVPTENLTTMEELLSAQELISQGIELLEKDKEELQKQMLRIKLAKKFLD